MDTLFLLAGLFGVGDLLLAWLWWHERRHRRKAEAHANAAIREKYKLLDVIERKAARPAGRPVVVPIDANLRQIRDALTELRTRQAAETGKPA